jgi:restriction system protein
MENYYRIMLGRSGVNSPECIASGFIGADFDIYQDLTGKLPDNWRDFNEQFIPVYLENRPGQTKIAAGLACGMLWTISRGILRGDIVICPNGSGKYHIGEVIGDYYYAPEGPLFHRRPVRWLNRMIERSQMSVELQRSTGSGVTACNISNYRDELKVLLGETAQPKIISTDETIENVSSFVMERHLEDFLIQNWSNTELGEKYEVFMEDGEPVGQQYQTDTGPLDILAVSKDKKTLLVVELKKGRASDVVVGQVLRYMGYVKEELAEEGQDVRGVVIALEDDQRIRRALSMVPTIDFFRYQISFKLIKGGVTT